MQAISLVGLLLAGTAVICWGVLKTVPKPHNIMVLLPALALYLVFFRVWVIKKAPAAKPVEKYPEGI